VRELYALDDERLLLVASDRISTFDVVLPTDIPDKGRVLTGLSAFWFARTKHICQNHLLALRDDGRSLECRRLEMLPIECVVRGYLSGSGWKDYRTSGAVCGHVLATGLQESEQLPEPIFTPATKAQTGHDENITRDEAAELVGAERFAEAERISLALYQFGADYAAERGILLADTKFELGVDESGQLVLADEALTPDSSRFWPADEYAPGGPQPSFDKQFVRDYCESLGWDKTAPGPEPAMKATVLVRPKQGILDPQGDAVGTSLRHLGFDVAAARVGRLVELEVDAADADEVQASVERMCEQLLANPLIESYEVRVEHA
jgi:phosphoribosylaminoimidazole-succinocarboxamide synthase